MNIHDLGAATDGHDWPGGYQCQCGEPINSPRGYRWHLVQLVAAAMTGASA